MNAIRTAQSGLCMVCGRPNSQIHHFAPYAIFGHEADSWPRGYLCTKHHREWHRRVTPDLNTKDVQRMKLAVLKMAVYKGAATVEGVAEMSSQKVHEVALRWNILPILLKKAVTHSGKKSKYGYPVIVLNGHE